MILVLLWRWVALNNVSIQVSTRGIFYLLPALEVNNNMNWYIFWLVFSTLNACQHRQQQLHSWNNATICTLPRQHIDLQSLCLLQQWLYEGGVLPINENTWQHLRPIFPTLANPTVCPNHLHKTITILFFIQGLTASSKTINMYDSAVHGGDPISWIQSVVHPLDDEPFCPGWNRIQNRLRWFKLSGKWNCNCSLCQHWYYTIKLVATQDMMTATIACAPCATINIVTIVPSTKTACSGLLLCWLWPFHSCSNPSSSGCSGVSSCSNRLSL